MEFSKEQRRAVEEARDAYIAAITQVLREAGHPAANTDDVDHLIELSESIALEGRTFEETTEVG